MRATSVWMVLVLATAMWAGCTDDEPEPTDPPGPTFTPPVPVRDTPAGPTLPPCSLEPGDISWTTPGGAPKPDAPSSAHIKTDGYGVSHIYADDMYGLWFANGYVQARDRLFQMDVLRLVARGESASVLGNSQLSSDMEVHRELYTTEEIEAQWQALPEEGKQILQAYTDGVNRFMLETSATGGLPGEFVAIGRVPPAWTPQDTVAIIDYLIGFFGVDGGHELSNLQHLSRLEETLGPDEAWAAFGDYNWLRTDDTYTSVRPEDKIVNGCEDIPPRSVPVEAGQLDAMDAAMGAVVLGGDLAGRIGVPLPAGPEATHATALHASAAWNPQRGAGIMQDFHWGSNAFLLAGELSATGSPIMWGAPQMGYYKPPIPYQIGLHGPEYDAVGIGVAGAPAIVIGRNAHLAWSATSGIEDQTDVVHLELAGPRTYLWDGEQRAMDCWTVQHRTSPSPADLAGFPTLPDAPMSYDQEVCRAEGWPVVAIHEEAGHAWLKKTTTRNEELMGAMKWLSAAQATSLEDFRTRMADFPFTFNFHVASEDGILFLHTGNIPLRADGIDPRLPTPSGEAYAWRGEVYTAGMGTWIIDPDQGYVANWNNAPFWGWRAGDQPLLWGPVHRVQMEDLVIRQALSEQGTLSYEDVIALNHRAAVQDSYALPLLPYVETAARDADRADVAALLREWRLAGMPWRDDDGDGFYDDPAHAVWDGILLGILPRVQGDEMGDFVQEVHLDPWNSSDVHAGDHGQHRNKFALTMRALMGSTQHDWCDDLTTPDAESCRDVLASLMRDVVASLESAYGTDPATWLAPVHESRFTVIGGVGADARPMLNKGSWVQVVAMGQGLDQAGGVLPPSNLGTVDTGELAMYIGTGDEPARLTAELDMYWSGQVKPLPLTAEEVASVAVASQDLVVI